MTDKITPIEKMFIDYVEDWCKNEMKYYTDKQYGKGKYKELLKKAKELLKEREELWDDGIKKYPGDEHVIPLVNCPKCDGEAQFVNDVIEMDWSSECTECGIYLGPFSSRLDLCEEWNDRKACTYCKHNPDKEISKEEKDEEKFHKKFLYEEGDNGN